MIFCKETAAEKRVSGESVGANYFVATGYRNTSHAMHLPLRKGLGKMLDRHPAVIVKSIALLTVAFLVATNVHARSSCRFCFRYYLWFHAF